MEKSDEKNRINLDLDDLQEKLGGISNYQIFVIFISSFIAFTCGPASQIAPFIAGTPQFMLVLLKYFSLFICVYLSLKDNKLDILILFFCFLNFNDVILLLG